MCRLLVISLATFGVCLAQAPAPSSTQLPNGAPRRDGVHQVDPTQSYHRVYAKVPIVGSGKRGDEIRPMFVPLPAQASKDHTGVIAWQMQLCDDGKSALVEFVGATPKDLASIVNSTDPNVIVFERGKHSQAEIEAEFQKYKKGFALNSFGVRAQ
jgi:hypothetical protein